MTDENGEPLANCVLKPQEIYRVCLNVPPDLMVYFDGLSRRSIGTVGHGEILRPANGAGLDDANHDPQGIFITTRMSDLRGGIKRGRLVEKVSCLDITPTILREFDLPIPPDLHGSPVDIDGTGDTAKEGGSPLWCPCNADQPTVESEAVGFTLEEEEMVKKRLMDLGYV